MPTNYNLQISGAYNYTNYLGHAFQTDTHGILQSFQLTGGYQEMPTLQDMYEIPISVDGSNVPIENDGGWSCGRRRIGMTVFVIETGQSFRLLPMGYFGNPDANGNSLGMTEWKDLEPYERAVLLDPNATVRGASLGTFPPSYGTAAGSGNPAECWVEIIGGDVRLDSTSYDSSTGELTLTMSDGTAFTETISTKHVFDIKSTSSTSGYHIGDADMYESGNNINPTLYVTRGESYVFDNNSTGHPFRITKTQGTPDEPAAGSIIDNGAAGPDGQVLFTIPHDAPDEYYYYCELHPGMQGIIKVISESSGPQGFQGDKGEKGDQGETGIKGDQGETGIKGDQGDKGDKGDQGETGIKGDQGDKGDKGDQGETGIKGDQGDQGENGTDGPLNGTDLDPNAVGIIGSYDNQLYYAVNGYIWAWDSATNTWALEHDLTGPQGFQGDIGEKGDQGSKGDQGLMGDQGDIGPIGPQGLKGDIGNQGLKGDKGDKGDRGFQGDTGLKGDNGDQGFQGDIGAKGDQGEKA